MGGSVKSWGVVLWEIRVGEWECGTKLSAEVGQNCGVEYGQVWLYGECSCHLVGGSGQLWRRCDGDLKFGWGRS